MSPLEAASQTVADSPETLTETVETISTNFHIHPLIVSAIVAVVLFIVAKIITSLVHKSLRKLSRVNKKCTPMLMRLLAKIISVIVWIIAIIAILGVFGIDLTPVLAGLGITGVVLGFALQESISSFFSGIMIAINSPFRVGDWVAIGDISGTVESMDLMCVTLSSGDNKKITMNNKNVWGNTITNYSYITNRRVDMSVSVSYGSDLGKTREVINGILSGYPEVLPSPAPVVEITKLSGSSIDFCVRPWVVPGDYWKVYWRFQQDFVEACRKNGIEIPFDQLDVHIVQQNQS